MPDPATQGLSRRQRITRPSEFDEAYAQGRKFVGRLMVLWLRSGGNAGLRLGVVSSRKVGNAPDRVRARRLLREAYRRGREKFSGSYDVVLIARPAVLKAKWIDIVNELAALARRAGLCEAS